MVELWQLDYGYEVKVLTGKYKGEKGFVLYAQCNNTKIALSTKNPPEHNYNLSEDLPNLELLSAEDKYNIKPINNEKSPFEEARKNTLMELNSLDSHLLLNI